MRKYAIFFLILITGCKSPSGETTETSATSATDSITTQPAEENYFPVTTFIRGQINDIRTMGVNPLKKVVTPAGMDSAWLKIETLENEFADFLSPVIDSANMKGKYKETKFLDATLGAYTWTYELRNPDDTSGLRMWMVYVDPMTNQVNRLYLIKQAPDNAQLQLTWIPHSHANSRTIFSKNGEQVVSRETTIKWRFTE